MGLPEELWLETCCGVPPPFRLTERPPFRSLATRAETIRLAVMFYVRDPLPLPNVEDAPHEIGCSRRSASSQARTTSRPTVPPLSPSGLGSVQPYMGQVEASREWLLLV